MQTGPQRDTIRKLLQTKEKKQLSNKKKQFSFVCLLSNTQEPNHQPQLLQHTKLYDLIQMVHFPIQRSLFKVIDVISSHPKQSQ